VINAHGEPIFARMPSSVSTLSRLESTSLTMVTTESEHVRADSRTFATLGHAHESITAKRNALHCPRWG